jgi:hypothetical protein
MLKKFMAGCKNVKHLVIPYYSGITDDSLSQIDYYLKNLEILEFKSTKSSTE